MAAGRPRTPMHEMILLYLPACFFEIIFLRKDCDWGFKWFLSYTANYLLNARFPFLVTLFNGSSMLLVYLPLMIIDFPLSSCVCSEKDSCTLNVFCSCGSCNLVQESRARWKLKGQQPQDGTYFPTTTTPTILCNRENCERSFSSELKMCSGTSFLTLDVRLLAMFLLLFFCCCLRCFCVGCLKLYRLRHQIRCRSPTFSLLTRWRRIVLSYLLADADVSCASARSINITWLRFVFCRDKMFPYLDNSNSFSPMVGTDV